MKLLSLTVLLMTCNMIFALNFRLMSNRRQFKDHQSHLNHKQPPKSRNRKSIEKSPVKEPKYEFKRMQCTVGMNPADGRKRVTCQKTSSDEAEEWIHIADRFATRAIAIMNGKPNTVITHH